MSELETERSTPKEYEDCAHVWDARGQLWCYSEPADVWKMREEPNPVAMVSLTSARSYQRLVAEFGPLRPFTSELYRVIWWQSLIQGMAQGETLEADVPLERLNERVGYWRVSLSGAVGVMIGSSLMSFVPDGDRKQERDADAD